MIQVSIKILILKHANNVINHVWSVLKQVNMAALSVYYLLFPLHMVHFLIKKVIAYLDVQKVKELI